MTSKAEKIDKQVIAFMYLWGIPLLRITLAIVFLWFGALKVAGASPVEDLISATYSFLPLREFLMLLGIWEIIIGAGLLFKFSLRATLILLWVQMLGTLFAPALYPSLFFKNGNIFLLTTEGEFVVKNFVLIAASIVIGGHELRSHNPEEL